MLSEKEPELGDQENVQHIPIAKNEKVFSEENTEVVAKQPFDKEINMGVNHKSNV